MASAASARSGRSVADGPGARGEVVATDGSVAYGPQAGLVLVGSCCCLCASFCARRAADHTLSARLLVHLGEVDARGLYREYAYASMFAYCVDELHMSEAQAYLRIQAARLGRQFPLIVELLAKGSLHLHCD